VEEYEYYEDADDDYEGGSGGDHVKYHLDDVNEDGSDVVENEYYRDGEDENEDGYYYADELYDYGEEEDGYFYLQDVEEGDSDESSSAKRFNFLPSRRRRHLNFPKATLSVSGIPKALPKVMSQFSNAISTVLPSTIKHLQDSMVGSGGTTAAAVLSIVMLAVVTRTIVLGGNNFLSGSKESFKKRSKRNWRRNILLSVKARRQEEADDEINDTEEDGIVDVTPEQYGEYSNDFVEAVREIEEEEQEDDDNLDLDQDDDSCDSSSKKRTRIARSLKRVPSATKLLVSSAWVWISGRAGMVGRWREENRSLSDDLMESTTVDVDDVLMDDENEANNFSRAATTSADESDDEVEVDVQHPSSSSSTDVQRLQQQLNEISESRYSLEQEYEASLRLLHEARMEVQRLKKAAATTPAIDKPARSTEEEQREKMETIVKKLEAKYKSQMKDQMEQIRQKMEGKLRSEVQLEMQERMESQLQELLKEQVQSRLDEEREQYQEELNRKFRLEMDEAVSAEVEVAVEIAVEEAVQLERQKAREEMIRVRQAIQKVLERERKLMKEQVRRATGQVREWVVKQQQEQLLQQAGQLQEEAQKLQGLAMSRAGGRGRRVTASGGASSSRVGIRPALQEEYAGRYEDTDEIGNAGENEP
jgi:hypothetical protein